MVTDEQLARMEALTARMEAAAARVEAAKNRGGQRGDAWHEKKRLRAELHQQGLQPPRAAKTQMCVFCGKHQPSCYCGNNACKRCCEAGYGGICSYHEVDWWS